MTVVSTLDTSYSTPGWALVPGAATARLVPITLVVTELSPERKTVGATPYHTPMDDLANATWEDASWQ